LGYIDPSEQLLRNLKNPKLHHFDVIKLKYMSLEDKLVECYACCQVGLGMSASSCDLAQSFKMFGFMKYKMASAVELVKQPNYKISASVDGQEVLRAQKIMLFQVNNTSCFGGGVPIAPIAQVDDGLLDVVWANEKYNLFGKIRLFRRCTDGGRHVKDERVNYYQAKTCRIAIHDKDIVGERDGEVFRAKDFIEISIAPFCVNYAMII
jgi:diacylglycerol kinase family enzyme